MDGHERTTSTLWQVLLGVLVALGLAVGALAIGHDESGGAHHAASVVTALDTPAADAPGEPGGLVEACLTAMLCGAALLLAVARLLAGRPLVGAAMPAIAARMLALARPAPMPVPATPDLTELSISRR